MQSVTVSVTKHSEAKNRCAPLKGTCCDDMLMKNRFGLFFNESLRNNRAESKKRISDKQRKMRKVIFAMKLTSHLTGQDSDTVLPKVSWATPTKQTETGVINM